MRWGSLSLRRKSSENSYLASPTFHAFLSISLPSTCPRCAAIPIPAGRPTALHRTIQWCVVARRTGRLLSRLHSPRLVRSGLLVLGFAMRHALAVPPPAVQREAGPAAGV